MFPLTLKIVLTLPSAGTSTVDHPSGSPFLCFPKLPSAVTSTVDHPSGSPSLEEGVGNLGKRTTLRTQNLRKHTLFHFIFR
jgi:hypothetical protein